MSRKSRLTILASMCVVSAGILFAGKARALDPFQPVKGSVSNTIITISDDKIAGSDSPRPPVREPFRPPARSPFVP
jgi:hypothetical protein